MLLSRFLINNIGFSTVTYLTAFLIGGLSGVGVVALVFYIFYVISAGFLARQLHKENL